jgi:hypothetical protein
MGKSQQTHLRSTQTLITMLKITVDRSDDRLYSFEVFTADREVIVETFRAVLLAMGFTFGEIDQMVPDHVEPYDLDEDL